MLRRFARMNTRPFRRSICVRTIAVSLTSANSRNCRPSVCFRIAVCICTSLPLARHRCGPYIKCAARADAPKVSSLFSILRGKSFILGGLLGVVRGSLAMSLETFEDAMNLQRKLASRVVQEQEMELQLKILEIFTSLVKDRNQQVQKAKILTIAEMEGVPDDQTIRILKTLEDLGYVKQTSPGYYKRS